MSYHWLCEEVTLIVYQILVFRAVILFPTRIPFSVISPSFLFMVISFPHSLYRFPSLSCLFHSLIFTAFLPSVSFSHFYRFPPLSWLFHSTFLTSILASHSTSGKCHLYISRELVYTNAIIAMAFQINSTYLAATNQMSVRQLAHSPVPVSRPPSHLPR